MKTVLTKQEQKWICSCRYSRLSDGEPILLSPMGAERFLFSILLKNKQKISRFNKLVYSKLFGLNNQRYNLLPDVENKNILVIPGYANNGFIFAEAGAKTVTVYDKDPVTIAWLKAIKKYYHYSNQLNSVKNINTYPTVGEILTALSQWYPPLIKLPKGNLVNKLYFLINANALRKQYLRYLADLIVHAVKSNLDSEYELDKNIEFYSGDENKLADNIKSQNDKNQSYLFDTVYVPYLLGVENGVTESKYIISFIKNLFKIAPDSHIFITPSQSLKQYNIIGKKYLASDYADGISSISELKKYLQVEDKNWMRTQGLIKLVLASSS